MVSPIEMLSESEGLQMEMIYRSDAFTIKKMAEGVYAAIAVPGNGAWSNAGFVDLGTELVVFDAFNTPSAAQQLIKQAEKLTGKGVKYLVNSHFHGDHVFGNQVFKEHIIISTQTTRNLIQEKNAIGDLEQEVKETKHYLSELAHQISIAESAPIKMSLSNQFLEMSKLLEELPLLELVLPNVTFEHTQKIYGTERDVELHCFGGGHTPSDSILYVPQEKAAFMGDLITEDLHLPIFNPEEFLAILEKFKTLDVATLLPGHGEVGGMDKVEPMIAYLTMLIDAVKQAPQNEVALTEFLDEFITPDEYAKWKGVQGIKRNLRMVYQFYADTNVKGTSR